MMVSNATVICILITLLVSLILPLILLAFFVAKHKKQGILSAWLLGAAGFFVTQILIRVPVLTFLQSQSWFQNFSQNHMFAYVFSLAFTAGLFELAGRFGVAKLMRKRLTWNRSLAAGLGHGGIEAMLLAGITYINNLLYVFMINAGTFDTVIAQTAAMGVDVSQLELIRTQLVQSSPSLFLLAGFERILAMIAHSAMSVLVCWGVAHNKIVPCTLVCLGIHTFIDLTAGLTLVLPQATAYLLVYTILIAVAVASLLILKRIHRNWKEVSHEK